jgi:hypothetical protein
MVGVLALLAAVGCQGPRVPHPLTNQSRYTCCNLHYEKPDITDVNFQQGTLCRSARGCRSSKSAATG